MLFEDTQFRPITFFPLEIDCMQSLTPLPDTSLLCGEKKFADVSLCWSVSGITCEILSPCCEMVELFIDTRDLKNTGYNTRFCHHFSFEYDGEEGIICSELTRFRTEDAHEHCLPHDLQATFSKKNRKRHFHLFIPTHCLYGYDPKQFTRLGFNYRMVSRDGDTQHLSAVSDEFQIEQLPSLWSTLKIKKETQNEKNSPL